MQVGDRSAETLEKLWQRLNHLPLLAVCADDWKAYPGVIPNDLLVVSKSHTHTVEAKNSRLRDRTRRYTRKTKAYSKSIEMAELHVYILFFAPKLYPIYD